MKGAARWLFWHRRDLRFNDNIGLSLAAAKSPALTGIFVLDQNLFCEKTNAPKIAPARQWFFINSLLELSKRWEEAGSKLIILQGDPKVIIPKLAIAINAKGVVWNRNFEPDEIKRDDNIKFTLEKSNISTISCQDQLLVDPEKIYTQSNEPYKVFTPFWNNWIKNLRLQEYNQFSSNSKVINVLSPGKLINYIHDESIFLDPQFKSLNYKKSLNIVKKLNKNHGFNGEKICPCKPGEIAANKQLERFIQTGKILNYKNKRDLPSKDGTSQLSAAINFGCISCRQVWNAAQESKMLSKTPEDSTSINTWEKELAWREFYQNALLHFPQLKDGPFRSKWKAFPWENNIKFFNSWLSGNTGIPIIDAAMRELNESGWMHNRCRMIVASFLVKDLICDWRWGEKAFFERLVDGDLAANNGGWQWSASSGMDSKPLRIFNPFKQAAKFDQNGRYIKRWIPELKHISSDDLINAEIPDIERGSYPKPIVNHKLQQLKFKSLYRRL